MAALRPFESPETAHNACQTVTGQQFPFGRPFEHPADARDVNVDCLADESLPNHRFSNLEQCARADFASPFSSKQLDQRAQRAADVIGLAGEFAVFPIIGVAMLQVEQRQIVDGEPQASHVLFREPLRDEFFVPITRLLRAERPEVMIFADNPDAGLAGRLVQQIREATNRLRHVRSPSKGGSESLSFHAALPIVFETW